MVMGIEMRCRIVLDCVKNIKNRDLTQRGIISVYKEDILCIRKLNSYVDNWQIHPAANVLKSKLVMYFPKENIWPNSRCDHHRVFIPKSCKFHNEFGILWTGVTEGSKTYNHLVPLIQGTFLENV